METLVGQVSGGTREGFREQRWRRLAGGRRVPAEEIEQLGDNGLVAGLVKADADGLGVDRRRS